MAHEILTLIAEDHDNFIHILADRKRNEAFVVDPAWDAEGIREVLAEENLTLTGILITHSHHDHVNAVPELYGERVSLFISEDEYPHWPDCPEDALLLSDGDAITFADTDIGVIKTPGHTPGSCCYRIGGDLITGDTLFIYGCGRADLSGSDPHALYHSLQKLKTLLLSNNPLQQLPETFATLQGLEQLDLSCCEFDIFPQEIGKLAGLKKLKYTHNPLSRFPEEILALSELRSLDLAYTQLTALPPGIARLKKLYGLYLAGNRISEFPPESEALAEELSHLDITGNPLRSLPQAFLDKNRRGISWTDNDIPALQIIGFHPDT